MSPHNIGFCEEIKKSVYVLVEKILLSGAMNNNHISSSLLCLLYYGLA